MKKTLMMITVLVVFASVGKGMEPGSRPLFPAPKFMPYVLKSLIPAPPPENHIYNDEGCFVTVPANITSINLITLTGIPVTMPLCAFYEPLDGEYVSHLFSNGYELSAGILYTVGGLPFYIVKKLLWDAPVYLYKAVAGEDGARETE